MGDRANLRLKFPEDKELILYFHWGGSGLHTRAQQAVKRVVEAGRWGDDNYAARIIISDMIPADGDLSYGIGFHYAADAEHPLIEVDVDTGNVAIYRFNQANLSTRWNSDLPIYESSPCWSGTAQDYVALDYDPRWQTSNEEEAAEA